MIYMNIMPSWQNCPPRPGILLRHPLTPICLPIRVGLRFANPTYDYDRDAAFGL